MKGASLRIPTKVVKAMEDEAERHHPNETGGVLLGYFRNGEADRIQVTEQVGPGPEARHQRHRFDPDGDWQAEKVAEHYARSDRLESYLGDWHSHPDCGGKPSALDRSTAKKIADCEEARAPRPLIVILHGEPGNWNLAAYRRERWRLRPIKAGVG